MKICWLSVSPWAPTGYGMQTSVWTPRFANAGHEVIISSTNGLQYAEMEWEGIRVFPSDHTNLNKRMLRHHVAELGSPEEVQVISLWDIWPWVDQAYGGIVADFGGLRIASWIPVDSDPVPPKTRHAIEAFDVTPIAMSRFGERKLREAGYEPLYVPHGIETDVFKPAEDRAAARRRMNIPEDAFLVGMVANNSGVSPSRKAFPEVLQAFSVFRETHPDAYLYLHTEVTGLLDNGLNLLGHAGVFGIPEEALCAANQVNYHRGNISKTQLAGIYSAFDVLVNPSYGEGFGLPIIEAQACGTPVIVTNFSSMPELCGAGWLVGGQPFFNTASGAYWLAPSTAEILLALEQAYDARGDQKLRDQAREFALGYDADKIMAEHWTPVLEALDAPREIPPLKPANRAARRRMERAAA